MNTVASLKKMDGAAAHRLRLDGMLRDLGARDVPRETPTSEPASETPPIDRPETITVGELVDKAAHSGFGFLVAVLSLIAIPFFGLSTPFGLAIALVGTQLLVGRRRPWLPKRARARPLKMMMLDRVLGIVNRRLRWLAASTRERWQPVVSPRLVGFGIVLLGLGLALPLPIPGSNMIFLVPIMVYAIGLLEGDGLWIVLAHLATLVNVALMFAFGATVLAVLERIWNWIL
jgi:hypothetical protein